MKKQMESMNALKRNILRFSGKLLIASLATSMVMVPVIYAETTGITSQQETNTVAITASEGWLESAYVNWSFVSNATGYNVYYKAASDSNFTQLDDCLIRQYPTSMRADVLGLKAGDYVIKVVPIINGIEATDQSALTSNLTVKAHTREGFGFSSLSPMGTSSGGYNDDGSLPDNAQILYITADTVNTVQMDVLTNASKGTTTTCTGLVDILAKRQKGIDQRPLIIRMVGMIKASDIDGLNSSGYIQIKGSYNTTFEGVGEDATANGWGFLVRDAHNVEIRNVGVMLFPDDGISLDTGNENIWVHNNDIFYGTAGSDKDQAKGDGSCDVKGKSTYVTVAFNHFYDSGKCSLCGMSDSEEFFVTYHHNWYDHSDSRHPRIRVGTIHIYNNYFDGNAKYGVGITKGGSAFVEANAFRNCKYPMLISLQGTDVYGSNEGTFSGEAGGMIKAYNNQIQGASRLVYAQEDAKEFDAYLASSRDEKVPSSYQSVGGANTYNNFDTASSMYAYTPDAPENVAQIVTTYAGRTNGGDFTWAFTEADDTDYSVNTALMAKIKGYTSDLVAVGGNSITETPEVSPSVSPSTSPSTSPSSSPSTDLTEGTYVHNFTTDGLDDDFFAITGNLSTSKGAVTYNGLSLSQCLKVESSTKVSFTTTATASLTLVFNDSFSGSINVDGTKYTATNGLLTVSLEAGSHTLTKGDSANLYYLSLAADSSMATTFFIEPSAAPSTEVSTEVSEEVSEEALTQEEVLTQEETTSEPTVSTEPATEM